MTGLTRRHLLTRTTLGLGAALLAGPRSLVAASGDVTMAELRGGIDASAHGVDPASLSRGARALTDLLEAASRSRTAVFLPPGRYDVSGIDLPDFVHLSGVPGATILAYSGEGRFITARRTRSLRLSGLQFDGANRWLEGERPALVVIDGVEDMAISDCVISGAAGTGLWLERTAGSIRNTTISGASEAGIFAVESRGLAIESNRVARCGQGGILVHRWTKSSDGTIVRGNRIEAIRALAGGTGENGNGINIFRADNVIVDGNHVSDCAFSAIRANAASSVRIADNHCLNSGETAIYSEFGFEAAQVSGNLVDGAANGISVVNFDHGGRLAVISGNIVRNLSLVGPYKNDETHFGVGIAAEADTSITGNVVEGAPLFGLALGWGPYLRDVVAHGNVIRNSATGCAVSVVEGAGACLISANLFSGLSGPAIAGHRWLERVTGDLALDPSSAPAHLSLTGNQVAKAATGG